MKQIELIKPDPHLADMWMTGYFLTAFTLVQQQLAVVTIPPCKFDSASSAITFDYARIAGAEHLLPGQIKSLPKLRT